MTVLPRSAAKVETLAYAARRQVEPLLCAGHIVHELPVLDGDALRPSGRAGGENHVDEISVSRPAQRVVTTSLCDLLPVGVDTYDLAVVLRQALQ